MNVTKLISVLSNVNAAEATMTANDGKLTVYSEADSVKTYAEMESEIVLPQIMVNVSQLSEALKRAEGANLKLTYSDSRLTLKTDNMSFAMDVKECSITIPIIPGPFYEYFETINFEGLKNAFSKTIGAASKDRARPQLEMINIDDNKVMATDSFAMVVYTMERVPETFRDKKFALSSDFVKHILKVGKKERTANIYLTDNLFYLRLGDTMFISKVGEPFRMDYERILKESLQANNNNALITTGDLKKALKALKPTLKQVGNRLNISLNENKTSLKAGDFNLEIASVYNSEPCQVTLNSKYIEVFLKTAGNICNIAVKNEIAPVVLTTDDHNYNFVLMPMR